MSSVTLPVEWLRKCWRSLLPRPLRAALHRLLAKLRGAFRPVAARTSRTWRTGPLLATVALSDWLFRWRRAPRRRRVPRLLDWHSGLSVVIPERGGGELLASCLQGLRAALAEVDEAVEVIVVVNGSPPTDYQALALAWPSVCWEFHEQALGFTRAVLRGVALARYGAIYLLNNDMRLEPAALREVMCWRAPQVFAIASQILFPEDGRRREETGWTFMELCGGMPEPRHEISSHNVVRGTVWAGAGSALFNSDLLRELLPASLPFDPFYWEDTDLGVRAWHLGYDNLYCPASRALHLHRVTVLRYFPATEVERIFERNRLQFQLRNPFPLQPLDAQLQRIAALEPRTLQELGSWRACRQLWRTRSQAWRAPYRDLQYDSLPLRSWLTPPGAGAAPVLLVSPFVLLPPRHGGAMRSQRLAAELAREHPVILLSDEAPLYPEPDHPSFATFAAVHLVSGPAGGAATAQPRIDRIHQHSHAALRLELERLIVLYRPRAVLIEHMELAGLVKLNCPFRPPFVLSLHDVLLQADQPAQAEADRFELDLIANFDAVTVCSPEDQALLGNQPSVLLPNGCDAVLARHWRPSRGRNILFVGPFRAPINWRGIVDFVTGIYPLIEAQVPGVSLTIVGGPGAIERVSEQPAFQCTSIRVLETVESMPELLDLAALTINPQPELRGSSLKVLESMAGGRVCVCTLAGARGHLEHGFRGLRVCTSLADFEPELVDLLLDEPRRNALEQPDLERLQTCSWQAIAMPLRKLLNGLTGCPDKRGLLQ